MGFRSITRNKASGGDGIPKLVEVMEYQLSYFKSKKMLLLKHCTQYDRKYGKLSRGVRNGKCQFSFQSQRREMPKNVQATS